MKSKVTVGTGEEQGLAEHGAAKGVAQHRLSGKEGL